MPDGGLAFERLAELRRRWEEDPSSPVFLKLAEEYRRTDQSDEALKVLEAGLAKNPTHLSAQVARGRCLLDLGRTAEAIAALEPVLERDATQLVARKLVVEAHLRQGAALRARRQLDLYASLNPGDAEIESLRSRIQDLLLDDAAPWQSTAVVEPAALPPPVAPEPVAEVVPPSQPAEPIAVEPIAVEVAVPVRRSPMAPLPHDGRDPFPELGRVDRRRFLDGLAAEGIFGRPEAGTPVTEPIVEAPAAVEEPLAVVPEAPVTAALEAPAAAEPPPEEPPESQQPLEEEAVAFAAAEAAPPIEEPAVPGPEDETLPFIAPQPAAGEEPATVTLGELYLRQGHLEEAERIFLAVLRHDPGNGQARAGLEALAQAEGSAASWADEVEPWSEEPAGEEEAGTASRRKVLALQRYLQTLRGGAERNVP